MDEIIGHDWLDWLLNITVVLSVVGYIWKFVTIRSGMIKHFDINEGNQAKLIHGLKVSKAQIADIQSSYNWDNYRWNENRITEYMDVFFDNLTKHHRGQERSHRFWKELTRGQKVFWSYLALEGEIDNGGLFQFLHNHPEHLFSARQVMVELKQTKLLADYDIFLNEVEEKKWKIRWNIWQSNNPFSSQDKQIKAFSRGYKIMESPKKIEEYFCTDDFKKTWHMAMSGYIEEHLEQYAQIV